MIKTFRYLLPVFVAGLLLLGPAVSEAAGVAKPLSESEAADLLLHKIQHDALYKSSATGDCLSLVSEEETDTYIDIAVRERHGGTCKGDPDTAPVLDRFRILRSTKSVLWYDAVDDEFVAYERTKDQ